MVESKLRRFLLAGQAKYWRGRCPLLPNGSQSTRALGSLTEAYVAEGHYTEAAESYDSLLQLQQEGSDKRATADTMLKLANALRRSGHKREAQAMESRSKALLPAR